MVLHVGAHKTASTHLQKSLLQHRDALARLGCCYIGPDLLRHDLALPSLDRPIEAVTRRLRPLADYLATHPAQRTLISDENILSRPQDAFGQPPAQLYPAAALRIHQLLAGLGLEDVTVALALRNPLDFLVSLHGHMAMAGKMMGFEAFVDGLDPLALRWSDLVARIAALPAVARVLLWRVEDYPVLAEPIAGALLGDVRLGSWFQDATTPRLTGVSAQALAHAQALVRADPALAHKRAVRRAMMRFPKSASCPALTPFAPEVVARAGTQYHADWAELQTRPDVTCLLP